MRPIRRCHVCGSHFRGSPERRHGRIRCPHTCSDAAVPDAAFVCATCRPEVVELTRHWQPRDPDADACGFCDRPAGETGRVELASVVDDRVVSRGTYPLCRECEAVFGTFLADLHTGVDLPVTWDHTPSAAGAVFVRDAGETDLHVEATVPSAPEPRLCLLADSAPVLEAVPRGPPRERAREFVAAFEAFYPGDGVRPVADAVVDGHPGLQPTG